MDAVYSTTMFGLTNVSKIMQNKLGVGEQIDSQESWYIVYILKLWINLQIPKIFTFY